MDFNNFYISGNGNGYPLIVRYLFIYFTCDVKYDVTVTFMTLMSCEAATASAACVARLRADAD